MVQFLIPNLLFMMRYKLDWKQFKDVILFILSLALRIFIFLVNEF